MKKVIASHKLVKTNKREREHDSSMPDMEEDT
jgi:hypothetical protein